MGVLGSGKTTLLDVLAQRVSMGVLTGDMFVSGKPLDESFQRKTGYVQQQDLHLETTTVREALRFSAMLRQPKTVPHQEKYDFVEDVIKMLNMQDFAEAVLGVPGQGLHVEQRKLLTIGVELAAKPEPLLFLDQPTSGLDSQSSWAIVAFLRKLADKLFWQLSISPVLFSFKNSTNCSFWPKVEELFTLEILARTQRRFSTTSSRMVLTNVGE